MVAEAERAADAASSPAEGEARTVDALTDDALTDDAAADRSAAADPASDADPANDADRSGDVDPEAAADEPAATGWGRIDWYACGALVVLALALVALHVRAYPTLSPIDELQHVDYTIKAGNFDVPRQGERLGQEAMSEAACRGIDAPEYLPPPCGLDSYDPEAFPERGFNTAASQLPAYYTVTGVTSRVITAVLPIDSQVTSARLVGGLWLGAALALMWYLLALFSVPRLQRVVVSALTMATPLVLFHSATVNADALLLLTGGLAFLATVKFEQGRLRWWWLIAVYVALILVEPTNLLSTGLGAAYLTARLSFRSEETIARRVAPIGALALLALARVELADRLRDALYPGIPKPPGEPSTRPSNVVRQVTEVDLDRVLSQLPRVFTPINNTYLPPPLRTAFDVNLVQLTNWLVIGLIFAAALVYVAEQRTAWLARLSVVAMLAAGPLYTFYYAYFGNVDFPAPGRFGLPLLPFVLVMVATAMRTRASLVVSGVLGAAVFTTTSYLLLTA